MLARPEPGTLGHVRLWMADQDRTRSFPWIDPARCIAAIYAEAHELGGFHQYPDLCKLDSIARDVIIARGDNKNRRVSFGEVLDSLSKQ